jgi:hypothetical protein
MDRKDSGMGQVPKIELVVRDFGQRLHAMMTLHHAQVESQTGVERVLACIGEEIINVGSWAAIVGWRPIIFAEIMGSYALLVKAAQKSL